MSFREDNQRVTNTSGVIELLEIRNPGFSAPLLLANDELPVVSKGITYQPIAFGFTLPDDVSGQSPSMKLVMPNVGFGITEELEAVVFGSRTTAKLILAASATPNDHVHVYYIPLANVNVSGSVAEATASIDYLSRQYACKQMGNSLTLPGLF